MVCSLDDPSTGVSHERPDILSQGSCVAPRPVECEADGIFSTTSLRCLSSGDFVGSAPTVSPSCSQMLCPDTLTQSGVGVNSTCRDASIGDTCLVFRAEGYQAVPNDTSILTCSHNSSDNTALCLVVTWDVIASLRADSSEYFRFTYNETCVVRCSVGYPGVGVKNTTEFTGDSDGRFQSSLDCAEESLELSTNRTLAERVLLCDEHFVQTIGNEFLRWDGVAEDDDVDDDSLALSWDQAGPCPLRVRQAPWESSTAPGRTFRRKRCSFGMTIASRRQVFRAELRLG